MSNYNNILLTLNTIKSKKNIKNSNEMYKDFKYISPIEYDSENYKTKKKNLKKKLLMLEKKN